MRRKLALYLLIATICICRPGTAQTDDPNKKLDAFLGKWQSEGQFFDTPFSKGGKVSSSIECRRSPQAGFLVCEQQITQASGKSIQLSIFSYNAKRGNYSISSMAGPGAEPWTGTFTINGNLWTYPGGFEKDGKRIEIRTTNDFSLPGTEAFKTEMSDDGGAHWTVTLQGTARRTGN